MKLKLRDIKKVVPDEYTVCFLWPECVKAQFEDGFFLSKGGKMAHFGAKYWMPISELSNILERPEK